MYLIDSNIWLGRLIDQARFGGVGSLLDALAPEQVCITDFALHTVSSVLTRMRRPETLRQFLTDAFFDRGVVLIHLEPDDIEQVMRAMDEFDLDFDDAYQYVAAEKHDLTIVSLDHDFDRTARGRKTPAEILER